jgi:SAM-dependent methyltransferase
VTAAGPSGLQLRVLEDLEAARNYNAWVAALARPHLGDHPIEIGSGLGGNAARWLAAGVPRMAVSDVEPETLDALRGRFEGDERVEVAEVDLVRPPRRDHTALVALNVLEHVEDDVAGLRAVHELVRPGGRAVIFVPAFQFAMSRFDRAIGHHRRYTTTTLRSAFAGAGLDVERCHYVNAPGLLAWTVGMKLLRMSPREGVVLRVWDGTVIPLTRRLESRRHHPPFGQSVLGVARVPL